MGWLTLTVLVLAHVPLGLAADLTRPPVATMHAWATLAVATWIALFSRRPAAFAGAAAYVTGAEVLWRMNGAAVPWEVSKYAAIVLFAVGIARFAGWHPRGVGLPTTYLLLLFPSTVITIERLGLLSGFEPISFNIAAHVSLALGVVFFANLTTDRQTLCGVLWLLLAPILAVAAIAASATLALGVADFDPGLSNIAASGGYGPNQVSAVFGLAALGAIFLVLFERRPHLRVLAGGLGLLFAVQGLLTFSRGGLLNLLVALALAAPFFLRTARYAVRFFGAAALVTLGAALVLIPLTDDVTGGSFGVRFSSSSTTLRTDLVSEEVAQFTDNAAFGTGVGLAVRSEPFSDRSVAAHTEFSRLLAEHGAFGIGVIVLMVAMAVRAIRGQPDLLGTAFAAACVGWSVAEMAHSATRLAAVAFVFALARVQIRSPAEAS